MTMSPRIRGALRIVGYVALALVTFVFALHLTFPYERVRDRALEALSSKYDVTVGGVERSLIPGRFALTSVTLRSRPSVVGQPFTTMYFKKVGIDLKFMPLLAGKVAIGLDIATGTGTIAGQIAQNKTETSLEFKLTKVPLTMIPGVSDAVGLPMGGNADGKLKFKLVRNDWSKANGVFELSCAVGCTVGDGQAKIYPKSKRPGDEAWVKDGTPVPMLNIQRFTLAIDVVKGEAKTRSFTLISPDGEADVAVDIKLKKVITDSDITGCIKYKCSKELYDREPNFRVTCDFGSPAIDADGMHHIKLLGKLSNVRRIGVLCDTGSGGSAPSPSVRPQLDAVPEPIRPVTPPPVEPPAPVEPPPQAEPPPLPRTEPDDVPPPTVDPGAMRPTDDGAPKVDPTSTNPVVPPGEAPPPDQP
ncbi:MAG: type II secretion system protein GspN [Kofleriaceae bacterium]